MKRPRFMVVVWTAVVVAILGVTSAVAAPVIKPVASRKFDHARHVEAAAVSRDANRKVAQCADCHQLDGKGQQKPGREHATRCVKCHNKDVLTCGAVKVAGPQSPARRCIICHEPTAGTKCQPADMPPLPTSPTFQAGFSHGKHIGFGAAIERECATCHTPQAPQGQAAVGVKGAAHSLCADCHRAGGRSKLEMTNCAGCHQPAKGKTGPSSDPFRLAKFDHRKHHDDSKQASCTGCHKATTGAADLPRPAMANCMTCHDGAKAFSAVGTKCTTCHKSAGGLVAPNRTDLAFSHATHAARNVAIGKCTTCHSIQTDGNLKAPLAEKNHAPCATSGCHQTEFMSKTTKICGVCHDASMPWQKATSRAIVAAKPEWFEAMNHAAHLAKKSTSNAACSDCHGDKLGGGKKPQGHAPCAECHGSGQGHPMDNCGRCHVERPPNRALPTIWSVAATFDHAKHATDPTTHKTTACIQCHKDVKNAKDLASVKKPAMADCDSCHNGKVSFKTTGFECSRCHTQPAQGSSPTASGISTPRGLRALLQQPTAFPPRSVISVLAPQRPEIDQSARSRTWEDQAR